MFAGLAIFFILTWKTREFDLNFAYQKFYFLLNQLVFLCFGNKNACYTQRRKYGLLGVYSRFSVIGQNLK